MLFSKNTINMTRWYLAIIFLVGSNLSSGSTEKTFVPINVDDITTFIPTLVDSDGLYHVRKGDLNSDGKIDLFVTGSTNRAISDFILIQNNQNKFDVNASMSAAEIATAKLWPLTSIVVNRVDLNLDRVFDFYLRYVDEAIEDADDQIVYVNRNTDKAAVTVAVDDRFFELQDQIVKLFQSPYSELQKYSSVVNNGSNHESVCFNARYYDCMSAAPVSNVSPSWRIDYVLASDLLRLFSPDDISFDFFIPTITRGNGFPDNPGENSVMCSIDAITHCNAQPLTTSPEIEAFLEAFWDYLLRFPRQQSNPFYDQIVSYYNGQPMPLTSGGVSSICHLCANDQQILRTPSNANTVLIATRNASYAVAVARAAWVITGVLLANDVTIVGTVDDVFIPIVILIGLGAEITAIITDNPTPAVINDVDPRREVFVGADPYALSPQCDPHDRSRQVIRNFDPLAVFRPSSARLKSNMKKVGCCPNIKGANAHHIVMKKGGADLGAQARNLLKQCNINLDEAANGVCLPSHANRGTNAIGHYQEGMHGSLYNQAIVDRLSVVAPNGEFACRQELDAIRSEMVNGTFTF